MKPSRRKFLQHAGLAIGAGLTASAFTYKNISEKQKLNQMPVFTGYDVVVCGGGPAGCAAALSASREGLKVLIVEMQAQLGGTGTSGLVSHWLGGRNTKGDWIVGGIFKSLTEEAHQKGIALIPMLKEGEKYQPHGWYPGLVAGIPFDPYAMAVLLDERMICAGVDVLLMTKVIDLKKTKNNIESVVVNNKSGSTEIKAKAFIDCTGDADIAAMSGCKTVKGRDEDHLMTPATLMFHVYNVDQDELADYIKTNNAPRLKKEIQKLREEGKWTLPVDIFISVQMLEKGNMMINTSRTTGIDGTDGKSVSQGLREARKEVYVLFDLMRNHFPGFKNSRIRSVSTMLGIRETRRIVGKFVLSVDDLVKGNTFEDTIGYSGYGWDLPDPKKPSLQPMHDKAIKTPERTPIPYRVMLPTSINNLICAGRMVSVERDVLGPLRVMAPCMAMGEAAGAAAAQVVKKSISFANIDLPTLKHILNANEAIL